MPGTDNQVPFHHTLQQRIRLLHRRRPRECRHLHRRDVDCGGVVDGAGEVRRGRADGGDVVAVVLCYCCGESILMPIAK